MLDDEARRALEQEAIALVNLSNSQPLTRKRPSAAEAVAAPKQRPQPQVQGPHGHHASIPGVHPLQQNKATLMARRDVRRAPHPHRVNTTAAGAVYRPPSGVNGPSPVALKPLSRADERRLSMSVFVNADGKMSVTSGKANGHSPDDHHQYGGAFELSPIEPTTPAVVKEEKSASPTSTTTTMMTMTHPADAHISMQSLLVNLKKRKPDDDQTNNNNSNSYSIPTKLPRFRDVFEPTRPEPQRPQIPVIKMQATPTVSYAAIGVPASVSAPASPPSTSHHEDAPPMMIEDSPYPPPPELKCKYRTGKCGNQRALKSCGDYHNLCNYHRLRANANQRKLDRKKKVQRGQPTTSEQHGSSSEATSPVAAASTLTSSPSSFLLPRAPPQPPQSAGHHHASAPFLPYLVPPPSGLPLPAPPSSLASSSMLRSKPESKSC